MSGELVMLKNERIDFLDAAKAFGIYLVILGHIVLIYWKPFRFIFAFHIPLFFVVAGFIWGQREIPKFTDFIKKLVKYYLIPLLVVFLLGIIQCFLVPTESCNSDSFFTSGTLRDLLEGHYRFSYFGASWFLICMFWAQLFFYLLMYAREKMKKYQYVLLFIIVLLLAVFSLDIFSFVPFIGRLPLKIDSAFMATVFMVVGFYASKLYSKCTKTIFKAAWKRYLLAAAMVIAGFTIVYFVSFKGNTYVNLADAVYARPERYLIGSVSGSFAVIGLGILCEKSKVLSYIGKNTLIIFLSHYVIIVIIMRLVNWIWKTDFEAGTMRLDWKCVAISLAVLILSTGVAAICNLTKKELLIQNDKNRTENK